jgi:hypothetical protein
MFTTRANDYLTITQTAIQLNDEQRVSRQRFADIQLLELRKARLQACIDTTYFRRHHNLHLSAREVLELELSQDRYPSSGMGWKKQRTPSILHP